MMFGTRAVLLQLISHLLYAAARLHTNLHVTHQQVAEGSVAGGFEL
jgi:hypothetical protein